MTRKEYIDWICEFDDDVVFPEQKERLKSLTDKQWEIREAAESDLATFIRLLMPYNVMGAVHEELCPWWTRQEANSHQLCLLPRDHGKSRYVGFRTAWWLTKNPDHRILYISSTSNLAEKQLGLIGNIFESRLFMKYWPEYLRKDNGKRNKWTTKEFNLDHPKRIAEGVRDPSVFAAGLTTGIVGMHCDVAVMDDVVVYDNAYTEEGRLKVYSQYSLLSSIESADAQEWVVGTRYHPLDLYGKMIDTKEEIYNKAGEVIDTQDVYEVFERKVEDVGDGTGEFLWPRQQREDGKWFGFNTAILARKRAKYIDRTQFHAQYYNNPNVGGEGGIDRSCFQYYDPTFLRQDRGQWVYQGERLNIIAAMDLSYSVSNRSDFTSIVVLGIDGDRFYYVLDILRFKTNQIRDYYDNLLNLYMKWGFKKLVAETTAAQEAIIKELKYEYLRPNGIMMSIEEVKPTRHQGTKEERMAAVLEPIYTNHAVYHYRGGNCQVLEDELVQLYPPHDDCKDALANAVEKIVAPSAMNYKKRRGENVIEFHPKFGGVVG